MPQSYRKKKGELDTKEIFSILDQLRDIGCFYLGFTGGEPFVRKDIMDIFRYAKKKGFEIIIYTNGSLIGAEIAKELSTLRPNKVDITIPAMSKENFERITQMPGSHKKVFGAIDLLHKKKINLGFKSCVLKENEEEIEDIQEFAASLGALHRLDDALFPRLDGSEEPYHYRGKRKNPFLVIRRTKDTDQKENIDCDLRLLYDKKPGFDSLFKCGVGVSQAAITPVGELKPCLMIDYFKYNILENSLKLAWDNLKKAINRIKPDKNYLCKSCKLSPYCKWCPAKSWLYNRSFTACDSESRSRAEHRRQLLNSCTLHATRSTSHAKNVKPVA